MLNNFNFSKFFYTHLIILGVHLGNKNKGRLFESDLSIIEFNKFLCLDIKQTFKELNKILLVVEFLCVLKGKLFISAGHHSILNENIIFALFRDHLI